jgi:hypothetical protein
MCSRPYGHQLGTLLYEHDRLCVSNPTPQAPPEPAPQREPEPREPEKVP